VKVAATRLNVTDVAPVRFVPVMLTDVPTAPEDGENEEMVGVPRAVTTKLEELVAVPSGVVTLMAPVVAPGGHDRRDVSGRVHRERRRRQVEGDRGRTIESVPGDEDGRPDWP